MNIVLGSKGGAVVRALASHQCGPGSNPGVDAICGLSRAHEKRELKELDEGGFACGDLHNLSTFKLFSDVARTITRISPSVTVE